MKGRVIGIAAGAAALALFCWHSAALADVTVIGGGMAEDCSKSAKAVSVNQPAHEDAIHVCSLALGNEVLGAHDLASTHVNRGVLYMAARQFELAVKDFDAALAIEPQLGEAFVNRGAAFIGLGRDADGITEINKGLAFNPSDPERAYYNRALAEENLNDLKSAYYDYKKAVELKPDWEMAKSQLARFTVVQK